MCGRVTLRWAESPADPRNQTEKRTQLTAYRLPPCVHGCLKPEGTINWTPFRKIRILQYPFFTWDETTTQSNRRRLPCQDCWSVFLISCTFSRESVVHRENHKPRPVHAGGFFSRAAVGFFPRLSRFSSGFCVHLHWTVSSETCECVLNVPFQGQRKVLNL